jgi:Mn-dependent DtxR family transcriptional regulator
MSGRIEETRDNYTVDELAQVLGVTEPEAIDMLEERGYHLSSDQPLVKLTEEEYRDLMEEPPLDAEPY